MALENPQTEVDPDALLDLSSGQPPSTVPFRASTPLVTYVDAFAGSLLVGRYFIERKLGQGGMAAVYLGRDQRLMNKPIVVKILRAEFAANEWVVTKFLQEKEALARVDHPGVVDILDSGELPTGEPFIVMEFIDGITLEKAILPTGMPLDRVADLIKQIGSALAAAHDKGILHRDLKPANIMLARNGEQVKLIDFGIARVNESLVSNQTIAGRFGTYLYMSPEQFRVETVSVASDVYSMGAIAHEMLTGRPPFNPKDFANQGDMYNSTNRVLPKTLRPELSDESQRLIQRALATRPEDRFQNASDFGDALAAALFKTSTRVVKKTPALAKYVLAAVVVAAMLLTITLISSVAARVFWSSPFRKTTTRPPANVKPLSASVTTTPVTNETVTNSLTYWLTIEKAKDLNNSFESSGDLLFESGDAFQFNVKASRSGYLYVLNEGVSAGGEMNFTLIYPTPRVADGRAQFDGGRVVQTGKNRFGGQPGREQFWIVWSDGPVTQLEAARDEAFRNEGRVADKLIAIRVREFFASNYDSLTPPVQEIDGNRTTIKSKTNMLVKLLELVHR